MRTFAAALMALASLLLFSCQKERDFANTNTVGNGTTGANSGDQLLIRMVQKTGTDSLVNIYTYDANKKLIGLKRTGTDDQGNTVNTDIHFHRNAAGIITDFAATDPALAGTGVDSIVTIVHYSSSRYTSYVIKINVPGFVLVDSSVFVYDGSGKIIGENAYQSPSGSANDYYLTGKVNYSYSTTGNLSAINVHDFDQSGTETFSGTTSNINYDNKVNPIQLGNEGFAMGHPEWVTPNNVVSEQLSDSNGPADNQSVSLTYTYNGNNRPTTGTTTVVPGNTVSSIVYYYQ